RPARLSNPSPGGGSEASAVRNRRGEAEVGREPYGHHGGRSGCNLAQSDIALARMSIYVASTHSRTARWCSRAFGPGAAHSLRFRSATQMIRAKRIIPFVVAIAIVLALGSGVYLRLRGGDTGAGDGDGGGGGAAVPTPAAAASAFATDVAIPVQGAEVVRDTLVLYRSGEGQAAADRQAVMLAQVSGRVLEVRV